MQKGFSVLGMSLLISAMAPGMSVAADLLDQQSDAIHMAYLAPSTLESTSMPTLSGRTYDGNNNDKALRSYVGTHGNALLQDKKQVSVSPVLAKKVPLLSEAIIKQYRQRYAQNGLFQTAQNHPDGQSRLLYYEQHSSSVQIKNKDGGSDFGLWSGSFLNGLLGHTLDAATFARNHENDPDYKQWRMSANWSAKNNITIRNLLAELDRQKAALSGEVYPDWVPRDAPALVVLSDAAYRAALPDLNICIEQKGGVGYKVISALAISDAVNVRFVSTTGTQDTIKKLQSGICDAGAAKGDVSFDTEVMSAVLKPVAETDTNPVAVRLFSEVVVLACNADIAENALTKLHDFELWMPSNTDAQSTWNRLVKIDSSLANIKLRNAANKNDAIIKAAKNKHACLLYTLRPQSLSNNYLLNAFKLKVVVIDSPRLFESGIYIKKPLSADDIRNDPRANESLIDNRESLAVPVNLLISNSWRNNNGPIFAKISSLLSDIK